MNLISCVNIQTSTPSPSRAQQIRGRTLRSSKRERVACDINTKRDVRIPPMESINCLNSVSLSNVPVGSLSAGDKVSCNLQFHISSLGREERTIEKILGVPNGTEIFGWNSKEGVLISQLFASLGETTDERVISIRAHQSGLLDVPSFQTLGEAIRKDRWCTRPQGKEGIGCHAHQVHVTCLITLVVSTAAIATEIFSQKILDQDEKKSCRTFLFFI